MLDEFLPKVRPLGSAARSLSFDDAVKSSLIQLPRIELLVGSSDAPLGTVDADLFLLLRSDVCLLTRSLHVLKGTRHLRFVDDALLDEVSGECGHIRRYLARVSRSSRLYFAPVVGSCCLLSARDLHAGTPRRGALFGSGLRCDDAAPLEDIHRSGEVDALRVDALLAKFLRELTFSGEQLRAQ